MTYVDLDEEPAQRVPVVVALGSNLGDRLATLQSAVAALHAFEGFRVDAVSPVYETAPVGGPDGQPDYLNAVLIGRTRLSPLGLLSACQEVEADHGRKRVVRWGPRTLDVDIVTYSDLVAAGADLTLPHPHAHARAFVLAPWHAVDPAAELPGADGATAVADLLARLDDVDSVVLRPDLLLHAPR